MPSLVLHRSVESSDQPVSITIPSALNVRVVIDKIVADVPTGSDSTITVTSNAITVFESRPIGGATVDFRDGGMLTPVDNKSAVVSLSSSDIVAYKSLNVLYHYDLAKDEVIYDVVGEDYATVVSV